MSKSIPTRWSHTIKAILMLLLLITTSCETEEGRCESRISETYTWFPGGNSSFYGYQKVGQPMEFRYYPNENFVYDICPTDNVIVSARVKGRDGYFQPEPDVIRVWWESDLGWFEFKDFLQLPRTADNTWSGSVDIGNLTRDFNQNTPANLEFWIKMEYISVGDLHDNLAYIEREFTEFSITVEYTKF